MTTLDEAQRARLPKAARLAFEALERRVAAAEAVAAEVSGADADVWLEPYAAFPRPVGKGSKVRFAFDGVSGNSWIDVRRVAGKTVEIMASTGVVIEPSVTNVVRVRVLR